MYVSSTELARELGVSHRSVQRWIKDGKITPEFTTPGGHHRFDVEKVRDELRAQARERRDQP